MPMVDAFILEGALAPEAEAKLMSELTDILIRHEGLDPSNERIRDVTWIFVHRPAKVYRAGKRAAAPIYRITPTVPEGQYSGEARASLVKEVTEAIARAERVNVKEVGGRVWVFPTEIFDGGWGSRGAVQRLPDIMEYFGGPEYRAMGEKRLAAKRRADTVAVIQAALHYIQDGANGRADDEQQRHPFARGA